MTIRALKNFGHGGENIPAGTVFDAKKEDFGGTFEDFVSAGLIEVIEGEPEPVAPPDEPTPDVPAPKTKRAS